VRAAGSEDKRGVLIKKKDHLSIQDLEDQKELEGRKRDKRMGKGKDRSSCGLYVSLWDFGNF